MYINGDRMLETSDNMKAFAFILLASLFVASCVEGNVGCPGNARPTGSCRSNRHCNSWSYCYRPGGQGLVGYCCAWKQGPY